MRKDLNMRKGKMVAQGSHASLGCILSMMTNGSEMNSSNILGDNYSMMTLFVKEKTALNEWLRGNYKKVCLYVNSEDELLSLYEKAKEAGLVSCLVKDSGLTEFHGQETYTCLGIGPDYSDKIDEITGELPLL